MDTSRRAVESYWRSRMIDGATSDEDKVTPVYKLEEICELLKSSPAGIVKEVSEFVLKRLDHKSPIVKQKALRLIKYSVGKSGGEFRREMQRHSVAVKQLLHYKGQPDPLKGDALNKAVRETAQDALSAIFSTDDGKPATTEVTHKRMEGFGNTNYVMPSSSEKKSFLTEVVDLGSASIKQGLSSLAHAHSFTKNDVGSYRGPTLQRSLNNERDDSDRYEKMEYNGGNQGGFGASRNVTTGTWRQDTIGNNTEVNNRDGNSGYTQSKTREERFLETIVTSGGVRLQPTRDALHAFVSEACKMDQMALCRALHSKLQAPHWQVRVKAVCVVEAFLRKKDYEYYDVIASYFIENVDVVIKCSESPQASLREKANRVLSLIDGGQTQSTSENTTKVKTTVVEMPDLIDTGDNDLLGVENPNESQNDHHVANKPSSTSPLIDDLFGNSTTVGPSTNEPTTDDDPFADVSFHSGEDKDLFAGMTLGEDPTPPFNVQNSGVGVGVGVSDPFDIFGSLEPSQKQDDQVNVVDNLMSGLSFEENGSTQTQKGTSTLLGPHISSSSLSGGVDPLKTNADVNTAFPMGGYQYNVQPGMLFNQFYPSQNVNYGGISGLLTQQQIMAAMAANFQTLGSMNSQNGASGNAIGAMGANPSPIPDIFNANMQMQTPAVVNTAKKEETKAFDFISDHLSAARDPKRVT